MDWDKGIPINGSAKIYLRIGSQHYIHIVTSEDHSAELFFYKGKTWLRAHIWTGDFGYPGRNKRKPIRIHPDKFGLRSSTGLYDKDIISFRYWDKRYVGKVCFDSEKAGDGLYPWSVQTADGKTFPLNVISGVRYLSTEITGDTLELYSQGPGTADEATREEASAEPERGGFESSFESVPEADVDESFFSEENQMTDLFDAALDDDEDELDLKASAQWDDFIESETEHTKGRWESSDEAEQMSLFDGSENPADDSEKDGGKQAKGKSAFGEYVIYTDGSSLSNPGPCGGAYLMLLSGVPIGKKVIPIGMGTNNIAELTAVIEALKDVATMNPAKVTIVSDSQYVIKGATQWHTSWEKNGWRTSSGDEVLNVELWKELLEAAAKVNAQFQWVRGHDGNEYNEEVDRLAKKAAATKPESDTESTI